MTGFTIFDTIPADAGGFLTDVTGMAVGNNSAGPVLYLANGGTGGISAYRIGSGGSLTLLGTEAYSAPSASITSTQLMTVPMNGTTALLPVGPYDTALTAYALNADGSLAGQMAGTLSAQAALPHATSQTVEVSVPTGTVLFTAHGSGAPDGYSLTSAGLAPVASALGTGAPTGGPITALAEVDTGTVQHLIAGMSVDSRLLSYTIGSDGRLSYSGTLGVEQGLAITTPTAIVAANAGGQDFAIVGAAGSSTLTVVAVASDGSMKATDQVVDDLNSRFAGVDHLTAASLKGVTFIAAAGSDDGISLFALTPDGHLSQVATVADAVNSTLAHVSGLASAVQGSTLEVFATSGTEPGLTALTVDLSGFGKVIEGGGGGTIAGTAGDDILIALSDADELKGGAGADTFVFDPAAAGVDGKLGAVLDYTPGVDHLDLSRLPLLENVSQLTITPTTTGADLHFGSLYVSVTSATKTPLSAADFTNADILNASHQPVGLYGGAYAANTIPSTPPGLTLIGAAGPNHLTGDAGPDSIVGGPSNDVLAGLDGNDTILGGDGADTITGGAGNDLIYGGPTKVDGADSIDAGTGNDTVDGGAGNDTILGGDGNDLLSSGPGNNHVYGGAGDDTLRGWDGRDTLSGGDGNDSISGGRTVLDQRDMIFGGAGNDTLNGGHGNDSIVGGTGADIVIGGFGGDRLIGNDGNDTLTGGPQSDVIFGGPGDDFLNGGFANDKLIGGPGADVFFHGSKPGNGTDWIKDYSAAEGDRLMFGDPRVHASDFRVNFGNTPHAGAPNVAEAFVIYEPTHQIIWALVDGAAQSHIELQIAGSHVLHDLLA
ncbi:MAG: hypothetical protein KGN33_04495 [Paracoccaceae bacterium]|nr:hypothetical protein [Paracoccaceae bacterium]